MVQLKGKIEDPIAPPRKEQLVMDELIVNPPGWLLKSGVTILSIAIVLGLALSWVIQYPAKIEAGFTLGSKDPPVEIVNQVAAPIDTILIQDRDSVIVGELLMVMGSTADWQAVQQLERWSETLANLQTPYDLIDYQLFDPLQLGELRADYAPVRRKTEELQYFLRQNLTLRKIDAIQLEIEQIELLNRSLEKQQLLFRSELELVKKDHERSSKLREEGLISDQQFESVEGRHLQQKRTLEDMGSGIIRNRIRQRQLLTQQLELQETRRQELETRFVAIQQDVLQLLKSIEAWKDQHYIHVPRTGRLSWTEDIASDQYIGESQIVAHVLPPEKQGQVLGRARVPAAGAGIIKQGDAVRIRLDAYPEKDFGVLTAQVDKLLPIPVTSPAGEVFHMIEMYLPDTMMTSYGRIIPFQVGLVGNATIVTRKRRLLEQLFQNILNITKFD